MKERFIDLRRNGRSSQEAERGRERARFREWNEVKWKKESEVETALIQRNCVIHV